MKNQIFSEVVTINAKIAQQWITKHDSLPPPEGQQKNRKVDDNLVDRYAHQMKKGLWDVNGEGIIIAESGRLLNGQHRLHAVIKSGKTIQSVVIYGVEEEAFKTIDTGKT